MDKRPTRLGYQRLVQLCISIVYSGVVLSTEYYLLLPLDNMQIVYPYWSSKPSDNPECVLRN